MSLASHGLPLPGLGAVAPGEAMINAFPCFQSSAFHACIASGVPRPLLCRVSGPLVPRTLQAPGGESPSGLLRRRPAAAQDVLATDDKGELPYRIINGTKFYLDELDIIGVLDGESYLRPLEADSYNTATFLWKKIADIDPERRCRLLDLLEPRHLRDLWQVAQENPWEASETASVQRDPSSGEDFVDVQTTEKAETAAEMLPAPGRSKPLTPEIWEGKVSGLPWPLDGLARFRKAFFVSKDGRRYGRVILSGTLTQRLGDMLTPLYFSLEPASRVLATQDIAQVSFDYADSHLHLNAPGMLPAGFPPAKKHPPKFDDDMRDYVCAVGPGVLVGQTWQEGSELDSIPRKFLGEFVLVRKV